ncbi:hypothetical protein [Aneurinibacillus aneurinilyticus]|uniref:hypothetical protein n=1 Tax=Aneurinibacillus aneurinilyticus TaxID=1391 RepID=UPI0035243AFC
MSIEFALFKYEDVQEEIHIDLIETHEDFELVRNNLFCIYDGCNAKIEYVPKGKNKAHFKTWPHQDHSKDCLDYFEREKKRKSEKGSATVNASLSPKHVNRVLRELFREANESEENKRKRLEEQRKKAKGKKKNITIDNSQIPSPVLNVNPTTGEGDDSLGKLKREPNVRKRHNVQLLNESDIGFTRGVYGIAKSISITENRVVISLSSKGKKCNVYFEESFFSKAATNIMGMFKNVEKFIARGSRLGLACVGQVAKRDEEYQLIINNQNDFTLNDCRISVFSFRYMNGEFD